jgi:hypothetical protein
MCKAHLLFPYISGEEKRMRFRRTTIRELRVLAVLIFICSILLVVTFFYAHYSVESKFFLIYMAIGSFFVEFVCISPCSEKGKARTHG